MRIAYVFLTSLALAMPGVLSAQAVATNATPVPVLADKPGAKDKMICQTMESTGSRLGKKRVCRPASEWAEINALDRREVERIQANRYNNNQ